MNVLIDRMNDIGLMTDGMMGAMNTIDVELIDICMLHGRLMRPPITSHHVRTIYISQQSPL